MADNEQINGPGPVMSPEIQTEQPEQQVPPPDDSAKKLYDLVQDKYDLGDYKTYREKIKNPSSRKALYDLLSHDYDLGSYDEYEKKISGSSGPAHQLSHNSISDLRHLQDQSSADPDLDVMAPAKQSDVDPDFANKKSLLQDQTDKQMLDVSGQYGFKPDDLTRVMKDFPYENDPGKLKGYADQFNNDPVGYSRFRAADENMNMLFGAAPKGMKSAVTHEYNSLQDYNPQDISGLEGNISRQKEIINTYLSGDARQKALDNLAINKSSAFNSTNPAVVSGLATDEKLSTTIDADQYAGLKTLEQFDPAKYNLYSQILTNADTKDFSPDQKLGMEKIQKELLDIGRRNKINYLSEQQHTLDNQYKNAQTDEEKTAISNRFIANKNEIEKTVNESQNEAGRFPYMKDLEFEKQTRDILGSGEYNPVNVLLQRFGTSGSKGIDAAKDVVTEMFGSDQSVAANRAGSIGETESEKARTYQPSLAQTESPITYQFDKGIKDQVAKIKADKSLTEDQKYEQVYKLVKNSSDQVHTITNNQFGKTANFFSKATMYKSAGMIGDVAGIAAQQGLLSAVGAPKIVAAATPMFLTTEHDFYKEALDKGISNPGEYATTHAAIMMAAGAINPDFNIVKRSIGLNSELGKTLVGVTEKTWNDVLEANKPVFSKIKNSLTSVAKETAKMGAVYGAGTSIANDLANKGLFNQNISPEEIASHAVNATRDILSSSVPLLGLNAITNFKNVSPQEKARLWDMGDNVRLNTEKIDHLVETGEISSQVGEQRKQFIKNVGNLIDKVPSEDVKGKPLTDQAKADYLYRMLIKDKIGKLKGDLPEVEKARLDGQNKLLDMMNGDVLRPGSGEKAVASELADLKFKEGQIMMKGFEGNGPALMDFIRQQVTGMTSDGKISESGPAKDAVQSLVEKGVPEHLIEAAIRFMPEDDRRFVNEMHTENKTEPTAKVKDWLYTKPVDTNEMPFPVDENRNITGFKTKLGSEYTLFNGKTTRNKSEHPLHDDSGVKETSKKTVYVNPEDLSKAQEIYLQGHDTRNIEHTGNTVTITTETNGRKRITEFAVSNKPEIGKHPLEFFEDGGMHLGNPITELIKKPVEKSNENKGTVIDKASNLDALIKPRDRVLQHIVGSGKLHPSVVEEIYGKEHQSEVDARKGFIDMKGSTIDQLAHDLWQTDPSGKYDTQDYKEAIEQVIQEHTTRTSMARELMDNHLSSLEEQDPTGEFAGWGSMSNDEKEKALGMDDHTAEIINQEGITKDNIDNFKHLFDGFPYTESDFDAVKNHLNEQGQSTSETKEGSGSLPGEERQSETSGQAKLTVVPEKELPPTVPPTTQVPADPGHQSGTRISKQGIFDQYGVQFAKTKVGWNKVTQDAVAGVVAEAERKGISPAEQAESVVNHLFDDINKGKLSVDENKIVTAALHLMNLDEAIDNVNSQKAETDIEIRRRAADLVILEDKRAITMKVLDAMGSKSGRNLGLYAGFFSKDQDGGVSATRNTISGMLGFDLPETLEELDKNTKISDRDKEKIRPYIERLAQIKADYEAAIKAAKEGMSPKSAKAKNSRVANKLRDAAKSVRENKEYLDKLLGGNIKGVKKQGLSIDVHEMVAKALEYIADKIENGFDIKKAIEEAAELHHGKSDKEDFKGVLDMVMKQNPEMIDIPKGEKFDITQDKVDADMERQRRKTLGELKALAQTVETNASPAWRTMIDYRRSFLIGGIKTLGRVAESGVSKLTVDPIVDLTAGNIISLLPGMKKGSVSAGDIGKGFKGLIEFSSDEAAISYADKKLDAFKEAGAVLEKDPENQILQTAYMKAELESAQSDIYRMIHGNVGIDSVEIAKYGSTAFDQSMGGYAQVDPKVLKGTERVLYYLNTLTRLHGVEKNPSARRALFQDYNTNLAKMQKDGTPLSVSARMRALDMAYLEFNSGKYQNKSWLSKKINTAKYAGYRKGAKAEDVAASAVLNVALPVAKIAINIVKSGLDYSTGGVEGWARYAVKVRRGMKNMTPEQKAEYENVWDKITAAAKSMPEEDRRYIAKVMSRGLFGAGLYALAAYGVHNGSIRYTSEYDKDHSAKRRYQKADGTWSEPSDTDYGQWEIAGHKFGKFGSSVMNHIPEFLPIAMYVNTYQVYNYEHNYEGVSGDRKKASWDKSLGSAALSDVNEVYERLPFDNLLHPINMLGNLIQIPLAKEIADAVVSHPEQRKPEGPIQSLEKNVGLEVLIPRKKPE